MALKVVEIVLKKINETSTEDFLKNPRAIDFLVEFINEFKDAPEILNRIRDKFSDLLTKNFDLIDKFNIIIENSEILNELLNNEFVESILPTLNQDFNQNRTKEKVKIIKAFNKEKLDKKIKNEYVNKCIQFAGSLRSHNNWGRYKFWLDAINDFVDRNTASSILNYLSQNYTFFTQYRPSRGLEEIHINTYKSFIIICKQLYLFVNEDGKQQIVNWFDNFLSSNKEISYYVIDVYKEIIEKTDDWKFANSLIEKFKQISERELKGKLAETLNLMLIKTTEEKGLNQEQIKNIIYYYFDYLFRDNKEAEKWLLGVLQNSFITEEIINQIVYFDSDKFNKASTIIEKIIRKYGFEKIYPKIKDFLGSTNTQEQITAIDFLYNLKESKIKIYIYKKELLLKLLKDTSISDDKKGKVEEWLQQIG